MEIFGGRGAGGVTWKPFEKCLQTLDLCDVSCDLLDGMTHGGRVGREIRSGLHHVSSSLHLSPVPPAFHWSLFHFLISPHLRRGAASSTHLSAAPISVILLLLLLLSPFCPPRVSQIRKNLQRQEKANLIDKGEKTLILSHSTLSIISSRFPVHVKHVKSQFFFPLILQLWYLYACNGELCQMPTGLRCKLSPPPATVDLAKSSNPQIPARWFASLCIFSPPLPKPGFPFRSPLNPSLNPWCLRFTKVNETIRRGSKWAWAVINVLFYLISDSVLMEFGAEMGKSGASAESRASRGSAALFCLTHTGRLLLYICIKSDLTTSGQLNAKARTHAWCTHWGLNPRSGFSGPHSAVAWVTCRKILTPARTQTHPWSR